MPAALGSSGKGGVRRAAELVDRVRAHGGGIPVACRVACAPYDVICIKSRGVVGASMSIARLTLIMYSPSSSSSIWSFDSARRFALTLDVMLCFLTGAIPSMSVLMDTSGSLVSILPQARGAGKGRAARASPRADRWKRLKSPEKAHITGKGSNHRKRLKSPEKAQITEIPPIPHRLNHWKCLKSRKIPQIAH